MAEADDSLGYCVMGVAISIVILLAIIIGDKKDLPILSVFLSAVIILTIMFCLDRKARKN